MLRKLIAAACFALLACAAVPSHAQPVKVVATCGVVSPAFSTTLTSGLITMDVNGNLCTAASVSASVAGFTPGLTFATLTATASSASVALPAGATVAFQNTGTTTVSCTLGVGSATAVAGQIQVPASSTVFVTVGSNTFGACIDETGSASNVVRLAGGAGLGTGFGGGGGGGGGGAVTVADGADVAQGALADAVVAAGATGSLSAKLRRLTTDIDAIKTLAAAAIPVTDQVGGAVTAVVGDPCQTTAKTTVTFTLATAAVKVAITGVSAKKLYICAYELNNNAADSVALFEATTGTTCATAAAALIGAGTSVATAGTGFNFAANGGIARGNGAAQVLATLTNAADLCIAQSAATQLSGSFTYAAR